MPEFSAMYLVAILSPLNLLANVLFTIVVFGMTLRMSRIVYFVGIVVAAVIVDGLLGSPAFFVPSILGNLTVNLVFGFLLGRWHRKNPGRLKSVFRHPYDLSSEDEPSRKI
ncbi:hypothetical protein RA28_16045 [Ruegeria sp. ANG-S4]|uniref:hypothetical protein n=1 Tax=Ruegeria sp. ANG-S4 TaxID=1577904 RepID=UPI00057D5213|nr:hypothetical protein [Ruegeria sp. ANG-S4]KIC44432.1 hypothetical protein RA28_16045 [Ruegeria sp. ANG-S4]